jgi:small subunit ribosomal protein S20
MRNSARKQLQNRSAKSRLHTLERSYLQLVTAGKKDDAAKALQNLTSAFDKAAKSGVVHRATANRKKSRLALRLTKVK